MGRSTRKGPYVEERLEQQSNPMQWNEQPAFAGNYRRRKYNFPAQDLAIALVLRKFSFDRFAVIEMFQVGNFELPSFSFCRDFRSRKRL